VIEFSWAEEYKVIENKKTSELSDSNNELVAAEAREQSELEP
jgi:hypothetical protein